MGYEWAVDRVANIDYDNDEKACELNLGGNW